MQLSATKAGAGDLNVIGVAAEARPVTPGTFHSTDDRVDRPPVATHSIPPELCGSVCHPMVPANTSVADAQARAADSAL